MSKWLRQALSDLEAAHDSLKAGHCEWACFQAQQSLLCKPHPQLIFKPGCGAKPEATSVVLGILPQRALRSSIKVPIPLSACSAFLGGSVSPNRLLHPPRR